MKYLVNQQSAHLMVWPTSKEAIKKEPEIKVNVRNDLTIETGDKILAGSGDYLSQYEITEVIDSKPSSIDGMTYYTCAYEKSRISSLEANKNESLIVR